MEKLFAMDLDNLQMFADADGADNAGTDDGQAGGQVTNDGADSKTDNAGTDDFKAPQTRSELDAHTNKAVQKALENYKKGEQERIAEAIKKEKDYAQLSAAERAKKDFEDEQSAFAKEKAAFEHEKLVVQVEKDLVARGLPAELAETFAVDDAETALEQVETFEKAFNKAVANEVKKSLRQNAPGFVSGKVSKDENYGASLAGDTKASEKLF